MKLVNNNISPLPFYDNLALQNHRKDYAYGQVYPLITYKNMLLPFQVVISSGTSVDWVRLYDFNTDKYTDITTNMKENGLIIKSYTNFKVLKYPGTLPIIPIKHEGRYYLAISISGFGIIYSDIFTVCNKVDDYLLLEYSNSYNFELKNGIVDFSDNFKFRCYLNTQIGKPEYDFEEEATDRMGYTFIESQVSKKIYKFVFLAPEYLCDALRIVRLCDSKQITSKLQTYDLTTFNMEPDWEDQGDLASVECEFETDTVIANIGGYTPELLGGDFSNEDFNWDYYDCYKPGPIEKKGVGLVLIDDTLLDLGEIEALYPSKKYTLDEIVGIFCKIQDSTGINTYTVVCSPTPTADTKYWGYGGMPYISGIMNTEYEFEAYEDFNGPDNTEKIKSILGSGSYEQGVYAAWFAYNYVFKNNKRGYLMSAGEAYAISKRIKDIYAVFDKVKDSVRPDTLKGSFWTSTINSTGNSTSQAWILMAESLNVEYKDDHRIDGHNVQGLMLVWPIYRIETVE